MNHYVNDSATAEWLRECADMEHDDGETLHETTRVVVVMDEDNDDDEGWQTCEWTNWSRRTMTAA